MKYSRVLVVIPAVLLAACGSSSAVPQQSDSQSSASIAPSVTLVSKQFTDLGITVKVPDTLLAGIATFAYDDAATADLESQTGCTSASVVTFAASNGNNYPVGSFITCTTTEKLDLVGQTPVTGTSIVFQAAIEKPFGLSDTDQKSFDNLVAQLSNSANYVTN